MAQYVTPVVLTDAAAVRTGRQDIKGTFARNQQIVAFQVDGNEEYQETVERIDMRKVSTAMHEMDRRWHILS